MNKPRLLSICIGMGLMDRAYMDAGFEVVPGCEIDPEMREMYGLLCGGAPICDDLNDLPDRIRGETFDGIIGGPPCQSHSVLRSRRNRAEHASEPKFPDLTPAVVAMLNAVRWKFYKFENVVPLAIDGAQSTLLDAMHFHKPHQSRPRWFTHSPNIYPPSPMYSGDVNDLVAYPGVYGRLYGPKRGAVLQGFPSAANLDVPCGQLQKGLANAVPYPMARAWAESIKATVTC